MYPFNWFEAMRSLTVTDLRFVALWQIIKKSMKTTPAAFSWFPGARLFPITRPARLFLLINIKACIFILSLNVNNSTFGQQAKNRMGLMKAITPESRPVELLYVCRQKTGRPNSLLYQNYYHCLTYFIVPKCCCSFEGKIIAFRERAILIALNV